MKPGGYPLRFDNLKMCLVVGFLSLAPTAQAKPNGGPKKMEPIKAYTVTYSGGPQWKANTPPDKQDLGGHFAYVQKLFDEGTLLANGLLADGHGFYVFAVAEPNRIDAIIAADPGVDGGVLKVDAKAPWALAFDNLSSPSAAKLFVINYRPGPGWRPMKPLMEQDLGGHLQHVGKAFAGQSLLAGGPVDAHQGRYVIAAADDKAASAWVNADPGVAAGVFSPEITPWQTSNRRSAARPK